MEGLVRVRGTLAGYFGPGRVDTGSGLLGVFVAVSSLPKLKRLTGCEARKTAGLRDGAPGGVMSSAVVLAMSRAARAINRRIMPG